MNFGGYMVEDFQNFAQNVFILKWPYWSFKAKFE